VSNAGGLVSYGTDRDVCLWHKADILIALGNVRLRGQSGHYGDPPISAHRIAISWRASKDLHSRGEAGTRMVWSRFFVAADFDDHFCREE
jgi:hypothetical protein